MNYQQRLERCESPIEKELLKGLYDKLTPDAWAAMRVQYLIDYYQTTTTLPDFAFPNLQIAVYCDGYEHHADHDSFLKDRQQSRALQMQGWLVLRFTGTEILNDTDAAVSTINQAIRRRKQQQVIQSQRRRSWWDTLSVGGVFAAGLVAAVVLMILIESMFPTLFYYLTTD